MFLFQQTASTLFVIVQIMFDYKSGDRQSFKIFAPAARHLQWNEKKGIQLRMAVALTLTTLPEKLQPLRSGFSNRQINVPWNLYQRTSGIERNVITMDHQSISSPFGSFLSITEHSQILDGANPPFFLTIHLFF